LFRPFTVWINCSSDLKSFANSRPSASNFKFFSQSLEQFFLTVYQNNFGKKIPFLLCTKSNLNYSFKSMNNISNSNRIALHCTIMQLTKNGSTTRGITSKMKTNKCPWVTFFLLNVQKTEVVTWQLCINSFLVKLNLCQYIYICSLFSFQLVFSCASAEYLFTKTWVNLALNNVL
jgi:hypothetical protein